MSEDSYSAKFVMWYPNTLHFNSSTEFCESTLLPNYENDYFQWDFETNEHGNGYHQWDSEVTSDATAYFQWVFKTTEHDNDYFQWDFETTAYYFYMLFL